MIAIDTNFLVYAHREEYGERHQMALEALRPLIEGREQWAIPWPCAHEFISVVTQPRIFTRPTPAVEALNVLEDFSRATGFHWLAEEPGYFTILRELAETAKIQGGKIHDVRIAALCLHHGVSELWTADRDFSQFPKLKTRNPLMKK